MHIPKPSPRFRLRTVIVVPFVLQVIAAVGLVGYLSFRSGQSAVNDLVNQLENQVNERVDQHLDTYLTIPHRINQINDDAIQLGLLNINNFSPSKQYFLKLLQRFDTVTSIGFADDRDKFIDVGRQLSTGTFSVAVRNEDTGADQLVYRLSAQGNQAEQPFDTVKNYRPTIRPWYRAAKEAQGPAWSKIYQVASDSLAARLEITAVQPYKDPAGNTGVLDSSLNVSHISKLLNQIKISPSGRVFIIERDGLLVASSTTAPIFTIKNSKAERLTAAASPDPIIGLTGKYLAERFSNLNQITQLQQLEFNIDGQRQFVLVRPWQDEFGLNWVVVITVPEADFMAQINANIQTTILLCLATLILTILLGILTARRIVRPVERITNASEAIAWGNLNQQVEVSSIIELGKLAKVFNSMTRRLKDSLDALQLANEELETRVELRTAELRQEKERSEELLLNVLPASIVDRLKESNESPAEHFEEATILFADIVGFTSISARMEPLELVAGLNQIFSAFDQLTEKYDLEKIKTIGDAYMVVGGLPVSRPDHAEAIANMALDMQAYMEDMGNVLGESLQIRIGINTGSVIAGVIGIKKFIYDLWGDAVNVASRMESHGKPGYIQVTTVTYLKLKDKYLLEERGTIEVKGRGEMITYWLVGRRGWGEKIRLIYDYFSMTLIIKQLIMWLVNYDRNY